MDTKKVFSVIIGKRFFPVYAPGVTNFTHKMRGKDGHGQPIDFTPLDHKIIRRGIRDMTTHLLMKPATSKK